MRKYERGDWPVYNVKALTSCIRRIFAKNSIEYLNKPTYNFIIQHMGFVAHYDLYGFRATYKDLDRFAKRLQTSEYSNDFDYNTKEASRQETDANFREWYGAAYQNTVAAAMRAIIKIARNAKEPLFV